MTERSSTPIAVAMIVIVGVGSGLLLRCITNPELFQDEVADPAVGELRFPTPDRLRDPDLRRALLGPPSEAPWQAAKEAPRPDFTPPTMEAHQAWDDLLMVAGQAGIRLEPGRSLSFEEWQWLAERVERHMSAIDAIDQLRFPLIEKVMDRKAMVGDVDLITRDTPRKEAKRLMLPTAPGQVVTAIGEGDVTRLVRVNLGDDYGLEAAHHKIKELERVLLLEVITKLEIR